MLTLRCPIELYLSLYCTVPMCLLCSAKCAWDPWIPCVTLGTNHGYPWDDGYPGLGTFAYLMPKLPTALTHARIHVHTHVFLSTRLLSSTLTPFFLNFHLVIAPLLSVSTSQPFFIHVPVQSSTSTLTKAFYRRPAIETSSVYLASLKRSSAAKSMKSQAKLGAYQMGPKSPRRSPFELIRPWRLW